MGNRNQRTRQEGDSHIWGKTVIGEVRDTMPHKAKIKNGAGIDLNPGFAKAFGLRPQFLPPGFKWLYSGQISSGPRTT